MKVGIVVFPGSNCDHDAYYAVEKNLGESPTYIWHKDHVLPKDIDAVVLPGGFSYGDYLRCGAIARFSPIMKEIIDFAKTSKPVIGICNGFQILLEAGLLPGALLRNKSLHFVCKDVFLKTINPSTPFTCQIDTERILQIPIAHGEGNYFAEEDLIKQLEDENRIVFQYCDINGNINQESNPNGSIKNIAGISNKEGNIIGMMPHPERYSDLELGCNDGIAIFQSLKSYINN